MALFFAVVPDENLRKSLQEAIGEEKRRSLEEAEIRWVKDDELHLTLLHLQIVLELNRLIQAATQELENVPAFEIDVLEPVDHTEQRGRRVIYAACREKDRFNDLLKACRSAAGKLNLTPSGSEFHAHITLGKSRGKRDRSKWPTNLSGQTIGTLKVHEVKLFESKQGGYAELSIFRLK